MTCSSHARSRISIDLFNLSSLLDERRQTTMIYDFPNDFFLPDRKNSRLNQIVNKWIFGRQTPDGNEGVDVEIAYLEYAYGTKYYLVDQVNGHINVIHDDSIESTEFAGHFSPFDLNELELKLCKLVDHHGGEDDSRLDDERKQVTQGVSAPSRHFNPGNYAHFTN